MCTRCVRFTREITQTGELQVDAPRQPRRDRRLPRPPARQPARRQRRRPLPGRRPARQGLPPQAALLVHRPARVDLHAAARPAATSRSRRTAAASGGSGPATTPGSTTTGSATRAATATRRPTTENLLTSMLRPPGRRAAAGRRSTWPSTPPGPGLKRGRPAGRPDRRRPLAVPDGRGGVPAGDLPQGPEPVERARARPGPGRRRGPDLHARPAEGPHRRHQLRRPPAVHDPRREVPEPQRRRGDPGALPGRGHRLRRPPPSGRPASFDALYVTGGGHEPAYEGPEHDQAPGRCEVPGRPGRLADRPRRDRPTWCSPAATFAEKAGCYVNADGRLQYAEASLPPRDGSLPDLDLLAILGEGPAAGRSARGTCSTELAGAGPGLRRRPRRGRHLPRVRRPARRRGAGGPRRRPATSTPGTPPRGKVTLAR